MAFTPKMGISPFLIKFMPYVKEHDAFLIVDDAHGIGVIGKTGRGIIEDYGLLDKVDMINRNIQ